MIVGFTGTQRGVTPEQWAACWPMLNARAPGSFHHGDCIGSDDQIAGMTRLIGFWIVGHPPVITSKRAFFQSDELRDPLPYLARNHKIVDAAQEMIATPGEFEEQLRSGTWATIRYARRVGKPVHVILPDGRVL